MNGIIGMTELLLNTKLSPEQQEYLHLVKQSADALLQLLNDILDFSKIEAGKLTLEAIDFDLRECLGDTVQPLAVRAAEKGLELALHVTSNVVDALVGDPGRLRQVLVNLIGNAIKFTATGEVLVEVVQESVQDTLVGLHFSVRDTGIGIAADKQGLIFEAFSQADSSTARRFGGTGLGLAIASQLVALMRGRIWVESEVDKGSTFHFTAVFDRPSETAVKAEPLPVLGDVPVLVVDDNATNRRILEDMLAGWKIKAIAVDSGAAALEEMNRALRGGAAFPLILVDYMMPRLTGVEFAERVRARPEFDDCEIIVLSSARPPDAADRCRALNIARWLQKPVKQSELLNALRTVFHQVPADHRALGPTIGPRPAQVPTLRILLAEDGLVNQRVAVGFLEMRGHRVVVARNGTEALAALAQQPFDVVLMDVHMPGMDGIEATAAIREKEKTTGQHLPIIAMTASAMKGDRERCLAAGMDGYVSKPFNAKELFHAVEATIALAPSSPPTKAPWLPVPSPPAPSPAESDEQTPATDLGNLSDIIDWPAARKRLCGREQPLARLFLQECTTLMAEIQAAIAAGQAARLRLAAHTLKGSADLFAATSVVEAARVLECMGRNGQLENAEAVWQDLDQQVQRMLPALRTILEPS
jgi:CheY-like chemotaxis protein